MNDNSSDYNKALTLSIFGHELDEEIIDDCKDIASPEPLSLRVRRNIHLSPYMAFPEFFVNRYEHNIRKERFILDQNFHTTRDMFEAMLSKGYNTTKVCFL